MNIEKKQFTKFRDTNVYTRTIIASTNIQINIKSFFESLPITQYTVIHKKKGRKPKSYVAPKKEIIQNNSIIFMKNEKNSRGINPKDPKGKRQGYFRNSIGLIISISNKFINVKVSQTGNFHMTGCTTKQHSIDTMMSIWKLMNQYKNTYHFKDKDETRFKFTLTPIMCNINFKLNMKINRDELDKYINQNTEHTSTLEPEGHTGVNIKMISKKNPKLLDIIDIEIDKNNVIKQNHISLDNYKKRKIKFKETDYYYNTFLVFQSGQVIMSGRDLVFMEDSYYDFLKILNKGYIFILEQLKM